MNFYFISAVAILIGMQLSSQVSVNAAADFSIQLVEVGGLEAEVAEVATYIQNRLRKAKVVLTYGIKSTTTGYFVRALTSLPKGTGATAIGVPLADQTVIDALNNKTTFQGQVQIFNTTYTGVYKPIISKTGVVTGFYAAVIAGDAVSDFSTQFTEIADLQVKIAEVATSIRGHFRKEGVVLTYAIKNAITGNYVRALTSLPKGSGTTAIGVPLADQTVIDTLNNGETFEGRVDFYDTTYIAVFKPLISTNDVVTGYVAALIAVNPAGDFDTELKEIAQLQKAVAKAAKYIEDRLKKAKVVLTYAIKSTTTGDFVRALTSLPKGSGDTAIGVPLQNGTALDTLNKGETFEGQVDFFSITYTGVFEPIIGTGDVVTGYYAAVIAGSAPSNFKIQLTEIANLKAAIGKVARYIRGVLRKEDVVLTYAIKNTVTGNYVRALTTLPKGSEATAIGVPLQDLTVVAALNNGDTFVGEVNFYNTNYAAVFQPIIGTGDVVTGYLSALIAI